MQILKSGGELYFYYTMSSKVCVKVRVARNLKEFYETLVGDVLNSKYATIDVFHYDFDHISNISCVRVYYGDILLCIIKKGQLITGEDNVVDIKAKITSIKKMISESFNDNEKGGYINTDEYVSYCGMVVQKANGFLKYYDFDTNQPYYFTKDRAVTFYNLIVERISPDLYIFENRDRGCFQVNVGDVKICCISDDVFDSNTVTGISLSNNIEHVLEKIQNIYFVVSECYKRQLDNGAIQFETIDI